MNAIATQPHSEIAKWEGQIDLVRSMVAKDATPQEFNLMLHMARTYGLDPLTKQIWLVKYGNAPASIFAGRDGFLEIGHRSGNFDGMDTKVDVVEQPINRNGIVRPWQYRATCAVYCKDMRHPLTVEVFEEEYTTGRNLWKDKPRTMIAKVSESQALRRAFRISGLYSPEEMPEEKEVERDVTPGLATAQAEFEKANGIAPEKPKPAVTAEYAKDTERMKNLPADIKDFFRWKKVTKRDEILKILTANNDDFEAIRGYMADQGWKGSADLSDVAMHDQVPA